MFRMFRMVSIAHSSEITWASTLHISGLASQRLSNADSVSMPCYHVKHLYILGPDVCVWLWFGLYDLISLMLRINNIFLLLIFVGQNRFTSAETVIRLYIRFFPRYWPLVRGIHRSPVNSPYKGQWRGALVFSLICALINGWVHNGEADDLRCHREYYDLILMIYWETLAGNKP